MHNSGSESGYTFTLDQKQVLMNASGRLKASTGVNVEPRFLRVEGDENFELWVNDSRVPSQLKVFEIEAVQVESGPPVFMVMDYKRRQVGPKAAYFSFTESVGHAETFAAALLEVAEEQRVNGSPAPEGEPGSFIWLSPGDGRMFESTILSAHEVRLVQIFADALGKSANSRGFAKFFEVPVGVRFLSIAVGAMAEDDVPIMVGSLVVAATDGGGYDCSARYYDNSPVPGPQRYSDIEAALRGTARHYFALAARINAGQKGSWLSKVRRAFFG